MRQGVIAAISTPPGKGGVAIIRLSGEGALGLCDEAFFPMGQKKLSEYPPRVSVYGELREGERVLDDCMAVWFEKGKSYTGEETVELSIHGGILLQRTVLEALFRRGAVPAEPGEFTRRAFLNGKISLVEVEAIGDLLEAVTDEQLKLSESSSRKRLFRAIDGIRNDLVRILGSIYARIDYPEEDLGEYTDEETVRELSKTRDKLARLIETYRTGRAINEGITTTLVGKPNVGKSTLYNIIVGDDVAIVTDIEGTTRDLIERTVGLGRVKLRLIDTAGVRCGDKLDKVEKIGIERTKKTVADAELTFALFDLSRSLDEADLEVLRLLESTGGSKVAVLTKSDIDKAELDRSLLDGKFDGYVTVREDQPEEAVSALSEIVNKLFTDEKIRTSADAIVSSARQNAALTRALMLIDSAIDAYRLGVPADAASSDVELALAAIGECDGRAVTDEVTSDIFSRFCVGK